MDTILLGGLIAFSISLLVRALSVLVYANSRHYRSGVMLRQRLGGGR